MVSVPEVSVGLAVRNARDVVGRCVETVLAQDFTNLELVVSDNASDDGTRDLISDLARSDPRIKLSVNKVNVGILGNVNRVLELSSGTFFPVDQLGRLACSKLPLGLRPRASRAGRRHRHNDQLHVPHSRRIDHL